MKNVLQADLEGKKVAVRSDLNLPIEDGEPVKNLRLEKYAESIEKISEKGAKVVVLAHQGRPGRKDFRSLKNHAELLGDVIGKEVGFVKSFFSEELKEKFGEMENGDVVLLENVRLLSEELRNGTVEEHSENLFVKRLEENFDVFVNDGFSVAHRPHGSMMGFMKRNKTFPGPLMVEEVEKCRTARDTLENPVLVLGGAKPADLVSMLEKMIERAEKVVLGGIPGEVALKLKGEKIDKKYEWIKDKELNEGEERFKQLLREYGEKFVVPEDLATGKGNKDVSRLTGEEMVWDIGPKTAEKYSKIIKEANAVVMKGPMGAYEEGYRKGSLTVLKAMKEAEGFTLLGGGHTSTLLNETDYSVKDFSHVSIAGGAFVRFMSGQDLPVLEALNRFS